MSKKPDLINKVGLPKIARVAKCLSVCFVVCASVKNWNDVVKRQSFGGVTPKTIGACPFTPLQFGKVFAVATFNWFFVVMMLYSAGKRGKHLVSAF